jgi:hypothetical protein
MAQGGGRKAQSRFQRYEGAHHGRDDPGHTDWVPTASIWHAPPVKDVQAGIQDPMVKLEREGRSDHNSFGGTQTLG